MMRSIAIMQAITISRIFPGLIKVSSMGRIFGPLPQTDGGNEYDSQITVTSLSEGSKFPLILVYLLRKRIPITLYATSLMKKAGQIRGRV